jgi:hypothetical protein
MVHFNTSDTSPLGKDPTANAEHKAEWALELMWTVWRGDVSPLLESELQFLRYPAHSLDPEQCHTLSWLSKVTQCQNYTKAEQKAMRVVKSKCFCCRIRFK